MVFGFAGIPRMDVEQISDLQLLDQTFTGGSPTLSGKHHKWDKLFIRVKAC